jgi:predicted lactoylglutathione lyase
MDRKIFVNLPIKDMARSQAFFRALGFDFNPQFTNEQGACMVISEHNYAMLLVEPFFQGFLRNKKIADARATCEVLVALSCETRAEVDAMFEKAVAAGATVTREPEDHGFMYARAFDDLDGHTWELFWMDPAAAPPQA